MHSPSKQESWWMTGAMLFSFATVAGCQESGEPAAAASSKSVASSASDATAPEKIAETPNTTQLDESLREPAAVFAENPKRDPIYDTETPGQELIAAALQRAQRDHKHVLIEWGGNWCGWCWKLHDVFKENEQVRPIVLEEYELVLVDSNSNQELMREYGGQDRQFSYPHLTVLDESGAVLTNQNTEPLEQGSRHNPLMVADFLTKWKPQKVDAQANLDAALKQASDSNRRVLIRVGTPYCGWCNVLAQFVEDHAELFAKDYVDLKLDTLRMTNGAAVAKQLQPADLQGVPWMVILDKSGQTLASSAGPRGNIGYPYQPEEIDHFISMLRSTRQQLSDSDLESISADLVRYREERERKRAREQAQR